MSQDPFYHNLIQFVPEKAKERNIETHVDSDDLVNNEASGQEIKHFYESIISDQPSCSHKHELQSRKINRSKSTIRKRKLVKSNSLSDFQTAGEKSHFQFDESLSKKQRQYFLLLKSAQLGNHEEVQQLLEQGLDVDYRDFYGWTALMSAAREGHTDVVDCLIHLGANVNIVNNDGQCAAWLAKNAGHHLLAEKLINCNAPEPQSHQQEEFSKFYCQYCQSEFTAVDKLSHESSVVHLLNTNRKHKKHFYIIPKTNKGFQMLLKTGWEQDKGLGPKGEGCKYPVKTVLKQDRAGLGIEENSKKKAKVTHFDPHDKSAVQNQFSKHVVRTLSPRKSAQRAAKVVEKKIKYFEHKLRLELNGDF
ncbi:G patch domain and ankyrin repeat-containing protein 1 [Biomphalaria glabrata]|nr:G patch domain and ankyrin repeat-containing protein 1 [Biomphalaria glabrata]